MDIKELKEKIKDLPDTMDVMILQTNDDFQNSMAESAEVRAITFSEEEISDDDLPEQEWPVVDCLVISDQI